MNWLDSVIEDKYRIVSVLKDNGKSKIVRLRNTELCKDIVKIEFDGSGEIYKRLSEISQQNLPIIYDVSESGGKCTVIEEFIDGATVSDILMSELYTEAGAAAVCSGLCDALFALHSIGIIHRDIKPENVMIDSNGRVVLIDFDAARIFKDYRSQDTRIIGTTGYAAPEQFGISQTDERTDIFSLGILMNVMLTGEHPSKKSYSGKLRRIIDKCIQIDPKKRYANVTELKNCLKNI